MNEVRKARLAGVIQEELSLLIRGLKDPRVPLLTITRVEVTDDGSQATVFLTLFGQLHGSHDASDAGTESTLIPSKTGTPGAFGSSGGSGVRRDSSDEAVKQCLEGLASASGYLRRGISKVLTIKHIPTLLFKEDRGLSNATRVFELLSQIDQNKTSGSESPSDTHLKTDQDDKKST